MSTSAVTAAVGVGSVVVDALMQPVELPLLLVLLLLAYTPQRLARAVGAVRDLPGALAAASGRPTEDEDDEK